MGFKDNLKAIKTELNTQEQFIEKLIRSEKFVRKYKLYILALVVIIVLWLVVSTINAKLEQSNIEQSNELYTHLLSNPGDKDALEKLKDKNSNLYTIFLIRQLNLNQNNAELRKQLQDLAQENKVNVLLKNILALNLGEKSLFLKDYDKILEAYRLLEHNKFEEASIILSQIKSDSTLGQIAKNFKHYQGISQ